MRAADRPIAALAGVVMIGFVSTFWWSPRSTAPAPANAPEANAGAPQFPEEERQQFEQSYSRVIWGPGIPAESPEGFAAVLVAGRYQNWQSARERLTLLGLTWDEFVGDRLERESAETGALQLGLHSDPADPTRLRAFVAQELSSTPPGQRFTASLELPDPGEWYLTPTGQLMNPGMPEGPVVRLALNEPDWSIPEWSFEMLSDGSFRVDLASKPGWALSHVPSDAAVDHERGPRLRVAMENRNWLATTWRLHEHADSQAALEHGQLHGQFLMLREKPDARDEASHFLELRKLRTGEQPTRWRVNRVK